MPQFLFALLLTMATDTVNIDMPQDQAWLHGRWLHVAVSSDTATCTESTQPPPPKGKHLLVFRPDGELRRYSPQKGWARLLMDFNVSEDSVVLHPQTQDQSCLMAEKTDEGLLMVCMPKYGNFYYKKVDPTTRLDQINFLQPPTYKSAPSATAGE